jgi:hypothetical protein
MKQPLCFYISLRNPSAELAVHRNVRPEAFVASIQEKLAWLEAVTQRIQQFVEDGGDLKSVEGAPLGMALFHALQDMGREFGVQPPSSNGRPSQSSRNGTPASPIED